jgi:hypothetical protein
VFLVNLNRPGMVFINIFLITDIVFMCIFNCIMPSTTKINVFSQSQKKKITTFQYQIFCCVRYERLVNALLGQYRFLDAYAARSQYMPSTNFFSAEAARPRLRSHFAPWADLKQHILKLSKRIMICISQYFQKRLKCVHLKHTFSK